MHDGCKEILPKNLIDNLADGKIFSDIVKPCPELGIHHFTTQAGSSLLLILKTSAESRSIFNSSPKFIHVGPV